MVVLLDTFKALKPWQVVVLVAVLLGGDGSHLRCLLLDY